MDIMVILEFVLNELNAKIPNSVIFSNRKETKTWENQQGALDFILSERESSFSLEIRAIRPSAVFGTRRRNALRGEGFAWVPDLGSFLKLREVGVSPYLGFILQLSTI